MADSLHREFLELSLQIGKPFHAALTKNGPVKLRRRNKDACLTTTLCRAVTGQQLSTAAAKTIWNRVLEVAALYPTLADCISDVSDNQLRECGLSRAKVRTLKEIAEAHQAKSLDVPALSSQSHQERSKVLTNIWGVGQWTSDMVGIFFFGEKDVWPGGDVTVCNTLQSLIGKRRSLEKVSDLFRPHRSYLAIYMYSIADARPN